MRDSHLLDLALLISAHRLVTTSDTSLPASSNTDCSGACTLLANRQAYLAFGRLAPYLERDCLRSFTPCKSSEPRTMW